MGAKWKDDERRKWFVWCNTFTMLNCKANDLSLITYHIPHTSMWYVHRPSPIFCSWASAVTSVIAFFMDANQLRCKKSHDEYNLHNSIIIEYMCGQSISTSSVWNMNWTEVMLKTSDSNWRNSIVLSLTTENWFHIVTKMEKRLFFPSATKR